MRPRHFTAAWSAIAIAVCSSPRMLGPRRRIRWRFASTRSPSRADRPSMITVSGRENFNGAWKLLCEGPGLRGEIAECRDRPAQTKARGGGGGRRRATAQVRARLHVDRDATAWPARAARRHAPGSLERRARRRGRRPGRHRDRPDDTANDRPASAHKLTLPCVVSGRIGKAEDVDWYAFELTKGERVGFEVWGNRLENKIHDLANPPRPDPLAARQHRPGAGRRR